MRKQVLFICMMFLSMMASITFISCGDDDEEEKKAPTIEEGLMLRKPFTVQVSVWRSGNGGPGNTGHFEVAEEFYGSLFVLEFTSNNTIYHYTAFPATWHIDNASIIPNHGSWVKSPNDVDSANYTIYEGSNTMVIANSDYESLNGTYVMKYVNGKLYSLINDKGEEEWIVWNAGDIITIKTYDKETDTIVDKNIII